MTTSSFDERSAEVKEHERRAAVILDGMYQFVALLTPRGEILEVNRAALEGAGHQIQELRGRLLDRSAGGRSRSRPRQDLQVAIRRAAAGEFVRYEVDIYGEQSGRRPHHDRLLPATHPGRVRGDRLLARGGPEHHRAQAGRRAGGPPGPGAAGPQRAAHGSWTGSRRILRQRQPRVPHAADADARAAGRRAGRRARHAAAGCGRGPGSGAPQRPPAAEARQHAAGFLAHRGRPHPGVLRADRPGRLHCRARQHLPLGHREGRPAT